MAMNNSIIIKNGDYNEVRCGNCGKLLFTFEKSNNSVDISSQKVIIVSRCTRSGCKSDNKTVL